DPDGAPDDRVADDPDRVRVRDPDRAGQVPGLADPLEAGQLAVAVEAMTAGVHGLRPDVAVVGDDDRHPRPDGSLADDEAAVAANDRGVPDSDAGHVGDRIRRTRPAAADDDPEIPRSHQAASVVAPGAASPPGPYHRRVIHVVGDRSVSPSPVRLEPLAEIAALRPIDVAEALRDLPGLALLESARPGRNARWTFLTADPVAVLTEPAAGGDPFAVARRLLARLAPEPPARQHAGPDAPPFLGGLVG